MIRNSLAILVFLTLAVVFFYQGTSMQIMLGDGDTFVHSLPVWSWIGEQIRNGDLPFWNHHEFSGYPVYAEPQSCAFHPLKLLFLCFSPLAAVNLTVLLHYALAGFFTFLLAKEEGLTDESSALAGVAYAFSGYMIGHQAMTSLLMTAGSLPMVFYALRRLVRRPSYGSIAGGACAVLILVLAGHPQLVFYGLFFGVLFALYLGFFQADPSRRSCFLKSSAAMITAGVALALFQLLPTYELSGLTPRESLSYEVFADPSPHPAHLAASLVSTRLHATFNKWGSEAMVDVGWPIILLAAFGVTLARRRALFWILLAACSSLLFLGDRTPLYHVMYRLPGYNLFRIPLRIGIVLDLALALLAAHGLSALQSRPGRPQAWLKWIGPPVLIGVFYYCVQLAEDKIFDILYWASARHGLLSTWAAEVVRTEVRNIFPWLLLTLVGLTVMTGLLWKAGHGRLMAAAVLVVAMLHFWPYRTWLFAGSAKDLAEAYGCRIELPDTAAAGRMAIGSHANWTAFIGTSPKEWHQNYARVGGPNLNMMHGIFSISGYSPLVLQDYSRFAGNMSTSGTIGDPRLFSSRALDLLNVRYVVVPRKAPALPEESFAALERLGGTPDYALYFNPRALGMFWGVEELRPGPPDEVYGCVEDPAVDFSRVALVHAAEAEGLPQKGLTKPTRVEAVFEPNEIRVRVETSGPAFLASSQILYPGWRVQVDDQAGRIVRTNGIFMGVPVPPGSHSVTFRFVPVSFWLGLGLGTGSLLLLAAAAWKDLLGLRRGGPALRD